MSHKAGLQEIKKLADWEASLGGSSSETQHRTQKVVQQWTTQILP